jgi:hypothetical protein
MPLFTNVLEGAFSEVRFTFFASQVIRTGIRCVYSYRAGPQRCPPPLPTPRPFSYLGVGSELSVPYNLLTTSPGRATSHGAALSRAPPVLWVIPHDRPYLSGGSGSLGPGESLTHKTSGKKCSLLSSLARMLVLSYDGPKVRRDLNHAVMVAFWTSVPLSAVSLAAIWPQRDFPWPVTILWLVVMASSAFLTLQGFSSSVFPEQEGERGETRRNLEWLVYPITLFLACSPFNLQLSGFSF